MIRPRAILKAAVGYVRKNPDEVVKAAKNATAGRFGVPLAALAFFAAQIDGRKAPKDIEIDAVPPALRLRATVDAMGTPVRVAAAIRIDEVSIRHDEFRIGFRLSEVKLALAGESDSPVATLIKSGALDLSKPGTLLKFIPKRPPAIVEAEGDRIVIDLMKAPKLAANKTFRRVLAILTPLLGVRGIETDDDHLYVALKATPRGLLESMSAIRRG